MKKFLIFIVVSLIIVAVSYATTYKLDSGASFSFSSGTGFTAASTNVLTGSDGYGIRDANGEFILVQPE